MKRLLSFILIIAVLSSVCVMRSSAEKLGDNITWTLDKGILTISGNGDMEERGSAEEYPWHSQRSKITGVVVSSGVTGISSYAFSDCRLLFNITISAGVETIGAHAFENSPSVKEITIPSSVTEIGEYAFYNCIAIRDLYLNARITEVSEYAFANCKSVNILSLPSSLKSIGAHGFDGCAGLFQMNFNQSLTEVGDGAFYNCKALELIKLPSSVSHIGADAFVNTAYYNNSKNWSGNALYIGTKLVSARNDISGELVVDDGTSYIADKVFSSVSFGSVTLPESVYSIEANAFEGSNAVIRCYEGSYAESFARANNIPFELITVLAEPVFTEFGLQLSLSDIADVEVIRTAYGEYDNEADIKRGEDHRAFNSRHVLKGTSVYTVQYRREGRVSVYVRYKDGHSFIYKFDITKKIPKFISAGNTVSISNITDFLVIRYAKGEYTTSSELKGAPDCVNISYKQFGKECFTTELDDGVYTFCVQYKDESYNFYTVEADSSAPRIFCMGDSLTMGIETGWDDIVEIPYPERLEERTGYKTYNYGVGSDYIEQIAMRMGAVPIYIKNTVIPADRTPIMLTPYFEDGTRAMDFCYNGFAGVNEVEIAGVRGKLTNLNGDDSDHGNNRIYFTRNEPGEEVAITSPECIITYASRIMTKDDILIIWAGSNDLDEAEDTSYFEYLVELQEQMIANVGTEKYLIVGYTADNYLGVDGYTQCTNRYNALMKEYWGEHFVDIKGYMATYKALADHGIEPTSDDRYRLARGWIPKSFLEKSANNIHFNQIGYDCVEGLIEHKLYEMGYIEK